MIKHKAWKFKNRKKKKNALIISKIFITSTKYQKMLENQNKKMNR